MKLYTFANDAYKPMLVRFMSSLKDNYEVIVKTPTFAKTEGVFSKDCWIAKTEMIVDAIKNNIGNKIIVCDVDIQFFRSTLPLIEACPDVDFLAQQEREILCIGFMVIKCNEKTLQFFNEVLERCKAGEWDQKVINEKIRQENKLTWAFLPPEIWGWTPEGVIPANIAAHHATFAFNLEDKLKQMEKLANIVKLDKIEDEGGSYIGES